MMVDESLTRLPQKGCNKPIKFIAYTIHHYAQSLTNPFDEAMATGRLAKYNYHPVAMWHFRSRQGARFFFSPVGTALLLLFFSSLLILHPFVCLWARLAHCEHSASSSFFSPPHPCS
jgi:hypothetical protein